MIPLKDNTPRKQFPLVNVSLIVLNVVVFLFQTQMAQEEMYYFIRDFGVIPREQVTALVLLLHDPAQLFDLNGYFFLPLVTATFLHGGWLHLISNMIYLWVFGDNIEDRLGRGGYLLVYLAMGVLANFAHIASEPLSPVPLIGASGAVAGVLGAYFVLFPRSRILTLVPLGFFITFIYIPAFLFLALWFILQLFNAIAEPAGGAQAVAWWAHVGGFVAGIVVGMLLGRKKFYIYS